MRIKAALLLLLVIFATTVTIAVMSVGTSTPNGFDISRKITRVAILKVEPMGDPIDSPGFPSSR